MEPLLENQKPTETHPADIAEFIKAQSLKQSPLEKPKAPCHGCKKSLTIFDVVLFGLALYGSYKLGITGKELIAGYFQKTADPE